MFTKHQGHHPSEHLLFKPSFKAFITKQDEQLKHVLCYVQMHTSLHSSTQQSHLTQNCLLLSPQLQLPEPSEGSGTTWSLESVIQHQAGCRRLDPACNPSCCCAGPCQKQRLWVSDLVWISAASCSVNSCSWERAVSAKKRNRTTTQQRDEGQVAHKAKELSRKHTFVSKRYCFEWNPSAIIFVTSIWNVCGA